MQKIFLAKIQAQIDKLWVKYSNGKFGFSVQKQIYQGVGGSKEYNWDYYKKFADKVGWLEGGEWLLYSEFNFRWKHNTGHFPLLWVGEKEEEQGVIIFLSCEL